MRTKQILLSAFLVVLFLSPRLSSAQFSNGKMVIGPHIGLAIGSSLALGANFEVGITEPGKLGPGFLGISGRIDYWSYSLDTYDSYKWITVGAFCNYHLPVDDKKWDLFAGLGLAYQNVSWSYSGPSIFGLNSSYGSGIIPAGNAGARYFLSPALALRAQLGFGLEFLVVGVDFALN